MFRVVKLPSISAADAASTSSKHRIFVIDCSGSMTSDLPKLKVDLKNKFSQLHSDDYFSIVWFQSGQNGFGTVVEHVQVRNAQDLSTIQSMIDKWLDADNGTFFGGAMTLANELCSKYPEPSQIFFMTDGCENQRDHEETLKAFSSTTCSNVTIVEYGFHTDHAYLEKLASLCGGQLVFSEEFEQLRSCFMQSFTSSVSNTFTTVHDALEVFEFGSDNELKVYSVGSSGSCRVPLTKYERVVYAFNPSVEDMTFSLIGDKKLNDECDTRRFFVSLLYLLKTRKEQLTFKLLQSVGAVHFLKSFNACVSRQEYEQLMDEVKAYCVSYRSMNFNADYFDPSFDVFAAANQQVTLLELLSKLEADTDTRVFPYSDEFKYKAVSRHTEVTTDDGTKVSFYPNKALGCQFKLVYNAKRANVSLSCLVYGHKVVDDKVTSVEYYRTFTVIRDGVKHVKVLPVRVSQATFDWLKQHDLIEQDQEYKQRHMYLLDISDMPVVLRSSFKTSITLESLAVNVVKKQKVAAERKYLKKRLLEASAANASDEGGDDGEDRPYKVKRSGEVSDTYVARVLNTKIAQAVSLPKVDETLFGKLDAGTANPVVQALFKDVHEAWKTGVETDKDMKVLGEELLEATNVPYSEACQNIEKIKFALLAGDQWFADVDRLADGVQCEHVTPVDLFGTTFRVTVQVSDVEIDV